MPNAVQKALRRDRVALKAAVEKFSNAGDDNVKGAEARSAVERVALANTGYLITASTASERNEFAAIVSELCGVSKGSIGLHGVEGAVKLAAEKLGIDVPKLPPEILNRLDKLV